MLEKTLVVITGAAGGLGSAMCAGLAARGARVLAADLPGRFVSPLPAGCTAVEADITMEGGCERLMAEAARHDRDLVLVNNAGVGMQFINPQFASRPTRFWELSPRQWTEAFEINTHSQFLLARLAAPLMLERRWGRIVNVSTSYATMQLPGFSPYGPSKAAVEAAAVIWAKDLAGTGVTVNALLPGGAADTRMITDDKVFADRSKLVQPQAMVPPLAFLASRRSDGVTGRRLVASLWREASPDAANLRQAAPPAGWSDQPHPHTDKEPA